MGTMGTSSSDRPLSLSQTRGQRGVSQRSNSPASRCVDGIAVDVLPSWVANFPGHSAVEIVGNYDSRGMGDRNANGRLVQPQAGGTHRRYLRCRRRVDGSFVTMPANNDLLILCFGLSLDNLIIQNF